MSHALDESLRWRRRLVGGLDARLVSIVRYPALYGPSVAAELLVVQLLQVRAAAILDHPGDLNAYRVSDALVAFNRRHFPGAPPMSLSDILEREGQPDRLSELLDAFCREQVWKLDLIALGQDPGKLPELRDLSLRAHVGAA